jgi:hypothetical protein
MPQPLSKVHPTAKSLVTPDAIASRPKLSPLLAEIIARWADIEANLRTILSYVLRAEAAPIAAMLHLINSAHTQMEMILAAGRAKLIDPELETFEAVMKIAGAALKKRNPLVHHLWAYSNELSDALLLVTPEAYSDVFVRLQKARESQPTESIALEADRDRTMVYRESDFRQFIEELKTVARCTTFLINYLEPQHVARDQMYRLLSSEPLMAAALTSIRKSRQSRPMPQQPNPQTENGSE